MTKTQVLKDSKNYLISVHDTLRRTFRNASTEESVFINNVLEGIEADVKQLEALEEMLPIWKATKNKKNLESITEE